MKQIAIAVCCLLTIAAAAEDEKLAKQVNYPGVGGQFGTTGLGQFGTTGLGQFGTTGLGQFGTGQFGTGLGQFGTGLGGQLGTGLFGANQFGGLFGNQFPGQVC